MIEPDDFQLPTKPLICHPKDLDRFREVLEILVPQNKPLKQFKVFKKSPRWFRRNRLTAKKEDELD